MDRIALDNLPKETLIKLVKMYSRNWQTLDGLWFGSVEAEYGLEAAAKLDIQNWGKQAVIEAKRIKAVLNLGGGLASVLTVLNFMSWQLTSPLFEIESESPDKIVFFYPRCPVQESRNKNGKPVFPCKEMKLTLLSGIASVIEPRAEVTCLFCPPDAVTPGYQCKWEIRLKKE